MLFNALSGEIWRKEVTGAAGLTQRCIAGAGTRPDEWAHADCDSGHNGCVGGGFTEAQKRKATSGIDKTDKQREEYLNKLLEDSRWEVLSSDSDGEEVD